MAANQVSELLSGQLERAVAGCEHPDFAMSIHEVRKSLKEARASLRVLRAGLGDRKYRRDNAALRDAARPLADLRDAEVLVKAFDGLIAEARRLASAHRGALTEIASVLERDLAHARRGLDPDAGVRTANRLRLVRRRVPARGIGRWDRSALWGIRRTYRRGRKAMREARRLGTDDLFHEWRKQVKYLANELAVLAEAAKRHTGRRIDRFRKLGELLGEDHDLAMLRQRLARLPHTSAGRGARDAVDRRLVQKRAQLQELALELGRRLYQRAPRRFMEKMTRRLEVDRC